MSTDLQNVLELLREQSDLIANLQHQQTLLATMLDKYFNAKNAKGWYDVDEVAELVKCSPWTMRYACTTGRIKARKSADGRWRISHEVVEQLREEGLPKDTSRQHKKAIMA